LELYAPEVLEQIAPQASDRFFVEAFERPQARDALSRLMYIDAAVFLPDDLMIKNDRMSMAHSIEARVPFTDLELTAFMSSVPPRLKLPRLRKKHLMRRALAGILPAAILEKKKVGLEMPYSRWLKRELHDVMMAHLGPGPLADLGLFRPERVQRLIDDHVGGRHDHSRALWGLLNYVMWHNLYVSDSTP
jgi:asparagine synthase (glutamine-hydrolysing)